ncbi:putative Prolamin-like domain-containing protein [Helianthus anomalus]
MRMASHHHLTPLITFTTCIILAYTGSSRDIFVPLVVNGGTNNTVVNGTQNNSDCWTALYEVKSCRSEITSYIKNGTMDIGGSCCQAIKTITHDCWVNLLNVVGIPVKESNVLRGYCDVISSSTPVTDPVPCQVLSEPTSVNISNGTTV